jgi:hypothetical protein
VADGAEIIMEDSSVGVFNSNIQISCAVGRIRVPSRATACPDAVPSWMLMS